MDSLCKLYSECELVIRNTEFETDSKCTQLNESINMYKLRVIDKIEDFESLKLTLVLTTGDDFFKNLFTTREILYTEIHEFFDCDIQFKVIPITTSETNYFLYVMFENKRSNIDYVVFVSSPSFDKTISLSTSGLWTEIFNTHNGFELELKLTYSEKENGNTFKSIYEDKELLDFNILVGDSNEGLKQSVGFHRSVLSAWSPVLLKNISGAWKGKSEVVLELPLKIEVIKAFKTFVYMDELPSDQDTLLGLVEFGSHYMIPKLETRAIRAVINIINTDNFYEILECSFIKKLEKLSAAILMKTKSIDIDSIVSKLNQMNERSQVNLNVSTEDISRIIASNSFILGNQLYDPS